MVKKDLTMTALVLKMIVEFYDGTLRTGSLAFYLANSLFEESKCVEVFKVTLSRSTDDKNAKQ
jgi:hypothetical protein